MRRLRLTRLEERAVPAVITWDGGPDAGGPSADDLWTTATNWVGDVAPQPGDDLVFPPGVQQLTATNDFAAGTAFDSLTVTAASYTLDGNAVSLTVGVTAAIPVGLAFESELALAVGGSGGLSKTGDGELILSAANTYTGVTSVLGGGLVLRDTAALGATGAGSGTVVASTAGIGLDIDGINVAEAITLGTGPGTNASIFTRRNGVNATLSGPLTLAGNAIINPDAFTSASITIAGGITEVGGPHNLDLLSDNLVIFAPGTVNAVTGTTRVDATVVFNGTGPTGPILVGTGTVAGTGSIGAVQIDGGNRLLPGPFSPNTTNGFVGTLTTRGLLLPTNPLVISLLVIDLRPTGFDQVIVNGPVRLGGGLSLESPGGFAPAPGQRFTVIANDGNDPVTGGFSAVPDGSVVATFGDVVLRIDYTGGDGNDVDLVAEARAGLRRFAVGAGAGGLPLVNVYDANGTLVRSFLAYDPSFRGGVNVAVGDFNFDGVPDVATAPGFGGGPVVRLWDGTTGAMQREFLAYDASFRGGVNLAYGPVGFNGPQIITGAGVGGGPHVRTFDAVNGLPQLQFFAYDASFRGGVSVAAGEPTRFVGRDIVPGTIITGAGVGGGPHVKVFNSFTGQANGPGFFAFDASFTGGVNVAFERNIVNPGNGTIVVAPKAGGGPVVRGFGADGVQRFQFLAYGESFRGGVTLAVQALGNDDSLSIITGPGPGGGPDVRRWTPDGSALQGNLLAFDPAFQGGVFVG